MNINLIKILIIVTNINSYESGNYSTGLWLSEFTHMYFAAKKKGYEVTIASPNGGHVPIDPVSLKAFTLDKASREFYENPESMKLLNNSKSLKEVENEKFDVVYMAGGHGAMYDFPNNVTLQKIIEKQYKDSRIVSAVCHGVAGLANVKLDNGGYLIKDKKMTGYSWFEESLANRKKEVPFNLEQTLKDRGSFYKKALIAMTSNVVVEGNLITGQNPFSSKKIAKVVIAELEKKSITKISKK